MTLRTILLIIGVLIILGIAFDGWRRKRNRLRKNAARIIEPVITEEHNVELESNMQQQALFNVEPEIAIEQQDIPKLEDNLSEISKQPIQENIINFSDIAEHDDAFVRDIEIKMLSAKNSANQKQPKSSIRPETIHSANEVLPKKVIEPPELQKDESLAAKQSSEVITLTVMSINARPFAGYDLIKALEDCYLHHGEYSIYHRHKYKNGKGPLYFSVASVIKPGTINPKKLNDVSTPGLALFMQLNNPKHDRIVFKQILATAHALAESLGGVVCDEKRIPLREASMQTYAERLSL